MRRELISCVVILAACSRPEPAKTTGFAHKGMDIDAKFGSICHGTDRVGVYVDGGNPVESRYFWRQLCQLTLDKDHLKMWGDAVVELQGSSTGYGDYCGLHIGPAEVNNPVPPTILKNFIDDSALAHQIDAKLAPIDFTREYAYQESVAGFQLDVVQQYVNMDSKKNVLVVDLRMNGCNQMPDVTPPAMKLGRRVTIQ